MSSVQVTNEIHRVKKRLTGAVLTGAKLTGTELTGAKLTGAELTH